MWNRPSAMKSRASTAGVAEVDAASEPHPPPPQQPASAVAATLSLGAVQPSTSPGDSGRAAGMTGRG